MVLFRLVKPEMLHPFWPGKAQWAFAWVITSVGIIGLVGGTTDYVLGPSLAKTSPRMLPTPNWPNVALGELSLLFASHYYIWKIWTPFF